MEVQYIRGTGCICEMWIPPNAGAGAGAVEVPVPKLKLVAVDDDEGAELALLLLLVPNEKGRVGAAEEGVEVAPPKPKLGAGKAAL